MKDKVRVLAGGIVLAGLVSMVFLACQMTLEWWQAKPSNEYASAELIWNMHFGFVLLTWTILLWLGYQLFGKQKRDSISDKE